jgi:hypothetical protein
MEFCVESHKLEVTEQVFLTELLERWASVRAMALHWAISQDQRFHAFAWHRLLSSPSALRFLWELLL